MEFPLLVKMKYYAIISHVYVKNEKIFEELQWEKEEWKH